MKKRFAAVCAGSGTCEAARILAAVTIRDRRNAVRILVATNYLYSRDGASQVARFSGDILEARGHDVLYFASQDPRTPPRPEAKYFVRPTALDPAPRDPRERFRLARTILWSREARLRLEALLSECPVDGALLHNIYHHLSPSIIAPLRRRGIPYALWLHDYKLVCPCYTLFTRGAPCTRCLDGWFGHAVVQFIIDTGDRLPTPRTCLKQACPGALEVDIGIGQIERGPDPVGVLIHVDYITIVAAAFGQSIVVDCEPVEGHPDNDRRQSHRRQVGDSLRSGFGENFLHADGDQDQRPQRKNVGPHPPFQNIHVVQKQKPPNEYK